MSSRFSAPAFLASCALLVSGAALAAGAGPSPQSAKAVGFAVSPNLRDLSVVRPASDSKLPAEWVRPNEELPRAQGPYANVPSRDAALQTSAPEGGIPGPALTFPGMSADDLFATLGFRVAPPDTVGDVGPDHYVQAVNVMIRVYDKAGNALVPLTPLSTFFASLGPSCARNDGDPIVLYDPLADRWLISQFGLPGGLNPPFHQCIGISQTGDPTGAFYMYDFLMPNLLNDYPHFGVWPDGYYMSDNQFTPGGAAFAGAGLFAFERSKMLVGDPTASFIYFNYGLVDITAGGMLPTDLDGLTAPPVGTPNLFMEFRADEFGDPADAIRIYEFHADFATPANSTLTARPDVLVAAFDARNPPGRADIDQPVPGEGLDSIADRFMHRLAYRTLSGGVQSFVMNWTVNVSGVNPTGKTTYQAGIRFTELRRDPGSGAITIQNQLTYAPGSGDGLNGRDIWMGSAAQDNQGNSALGFSASSTTLNPSIVWAGRLAGDPANTFNQGEATMFAGGGVQTSTSGRWGDYSAMSVDPSDDCTFFYTQEFYTATGSFDWATRVGSFKYASCTAAPKGTLSGTITRCANGLPLDGATIAVEGGYTRISNAIGDYSMDLPPGTYNVTVSLAGYSVFNGQATINDGQTTDFDACLSGSPSLSAISSSIVSESCPPGNGVIDPGETVTVSLCIRNTGGADTGNLIATLDETGGVHDPSGPESYGVVVAGGADVCVNFTFTADTSLACGSILTATLLLDDGTPRGAIAYDFQTGTVNQALSQNFDGAVPPALPAGWTTTGSGNLWVTDTTTPDTPPNHAFADDPSVVTDKYLDSPSIPITSAVARLTFRNSYQTESTYDGGVLEISIGGGPFQDILVAGGSFVTGGYNATISTLFGSPIAGRQAWSGNSGGYLTCVANLPAAAAGQNVVLRWRMASDVSVAATGWRVDTISVNDGFTCCTPIPAALAVDEAPSDSSDVNGVFEPGETVIVAPTYFNGDVFVIPALTGAASNFTGPAGATYTLVDAAASYGSIAPNAEATCSDCYTVALDNPARPIQHWDASFLETTSTGGPKTWTLHVGASFSDVPTANMFYRFIETIFHKGVTGGCGGTAYCPGNPALRKQMAVFLLKSRDGAAFVPPAAVGIFADVPAADPFAPWIEELFNRGVTGGCSAVPLNYCPDNTVLRKQMAVFLLKTLKGSAYTPPACVGLFGDVVCPSTFADWIEDLSNRGITGGCGGGNFCPDAPNTRGQMAVFLTKTFDLLLYGP